MITPPEHTERIETRLGQLHTRVIGTGRTTVLWSSMFVDSHTWDPTLTLLLDGSREPRRLVLVDPPGLGLSQPLRRRSSIAEAAGAARDLLKALDAGRVDWVGNAFGGHVGYELARDPSLLRSFVAISSPTEPIPPHLRRKIGVLKPLLRIAGPVGPVREAIVSAMLTEESASNSHLRQVVLDSLGRPTRSSMAFALRSFILDRSDVTGHLADIRIPSLFVASDDRGDWSPADAQRAAALTPDATAVTIERARTLIPLEQPAALATSIVNFWAGVPATNSPV
ncbi:alpha/beta hydrolase [Mycetocola manganoxydans]|uniref:Alpha/beta hydrolase n=1 Tax=Mycetocola manganoxydans TaxID=699879 RepID=A0A3L6ZYU7_9MICO|nr:alpha/beta hydrolase [Mycetocola manganoxydans]RLP72332.1 alpha/beta hydrolase [Mycetocola manganoxydans]GHD40933.1 putative hydrolase, alpha/beta fold protein [Mycetocola manganoxydans]